MKILQIVQKPQRRGAEVFAFQLSAELRRQGHLVRIVYLYPHQGHSTLPIHSQDILLDSTENHPAETWLSVQPWLLVRLKKVINAFQPDVIQANGGRTVKYGAFSYLFQQDNRWGLIYRNIGHPKDWVQGLPRRLLYKQMVMPQIDGVVGVSQVTLAYVKQFYGLSVPMMHIPNGVDIASLSPAYSREAVRQQHQTPLDVPVIIYVGSLTSEKRPDRLLRLFQQVQSHYPQAQLWLIGDGPLRPQLEQQVANCNLRSSIKFFGIQDEIGSYLNAADVFLLASDTEGIPAVVLEAGYLRLPVVASWVGGLPECIQNGETGVLVKPTDEIGFIQAILNLLDHPSYRFEMGQKAGRWIEANFTIDKIARQYALFYQEVKKTR